MRTRFVRLALHFLSLYHIYEKRNDDDDDDDDDDDNASFSNEKFAHHLRGANSFGYMYHGLAVLSTSLPLFLPTKSAYNKLHTSFNSDFTKG